jgi:hypothetical protein
MLKILSSNDKNFKSSFTGECRPLYNYVHYCRVLLYLEFSEKTKKYDSN